MSSKLSPNGSKPSPTSAVLSGPTRTCRVCRTKHPKAELTRWVIQPDGSLTRDSAQRLPGRGLYSCSPECAAKLPLVARGHRNHKVRK